MVLGEHAICAELTALRRALWIGCRARAEGAWFAVRHAALRLIDAVVVDIVPDGAEDSAMSPVVRLRAGRREIELPLVRVTEALEESPATATFGSPIGTAH